MPDNNAIINLDYDIIEQEAKNIETCSRSIQEIGKNIDVINQNLASCWSGDAYEAYNTRMTNLSEGVFPPMAKVLEDMSVLLTSTANNMKKADGSIGDSIKQVLQDAIDAVLGN